MSNEDLRTLARPGLDHVMVPVLDASAATAQAERLGFVVRPFRSVEPLGGGESGGVGGSSLVMFRSRSDHLANFIELVQLAPEQAPPQVVNLLDRQRGAAVLMYSTLDLEALQSMWDPDRSSSEIFPMHMPAVGHVAAQDVGLLIMERRLPLCRCAVKWSTLADYQVEAYLVHPNSAYLWDRLTYVAPDGRTLKLLTPFIDALDTSPEDQVEVELVGPQAVGRMVPSRSWMADDQLTPILRIRVRDIEQLAAAIGPDVEVHGCGPERWVGPEAAWGCVLHFLEQGADTP